MIKNDLFVLFSQNYPSLIHYIFLWPGNRRNDNLFPSNHKTNTVYCYMVIMFILSDGWLNIVPVLLAWSSIDPVLGNCPVIAV